MTGTTSAMLGVVNYQSRHVTLKIWSKNGAIFEDIFPTDQTTFAHVKYSAMRVLLNNDNNKNNYNLISIESKKMVNEEKTLGEEKVKDGDEYLLAKKLSKQSSEPEQTLKPCLIDEKLIDIRTKDLPTSSHASHRADRLTRPEFRTDLQRILLTLIETSQKLLWCRSDAKLIFKQAEEILLNSSTPSNDIQIDQQQIIKLVDFGFTEQQAQIALKRTKNDFDAAMEILLNEPDINNDADENETKPIHRIPFYSSNTPFIPYRQIRQQYFQPNPTVVQSLQEMGFNHDDIIHALRICHNDQNLACDYLIADKKQQEKIDDTDNDQGLDPKSRIFRAIMENPIIQQTLNNPKIFFVMLQLYENPSSISIYINDPDIGNLLLQISRIYHTERYRLNTQ